MTILNLLVGACGERVAFVFDAAVVGGDDAEVTTKALYLPHIRAAVGATGELRLLQQWADALLAGLPAGTTAADLAASAQTFLQDAWARTARNPSAIYLAGAIDGDHVAAWVFTSPAFTPQRFAPGVYLAPRILPDVPDDAAPEPPAAPLPAVIAPPEPWAHDWPGTVAAGVSCFQRQREQRRVASGGHVELLVVTPDGAHSTRLRDLEFEAPA